MSNNEHEGKKAGAEPKGVVEVLVKRKGRGVFDGREKNHQTRLELSLP